MEPYNPVSTLRWTTRPGLEAGGRVVTVTGQTVTGRRADYNMAFTEEEMKYNSPYFFAVLLERMQEKILEFIA